MASGSFNLESDISTLQGKIVWSSSSNGSAANSSTVTATLYVARTDSYTTTGTWEFGFNVGGSTAFENPHASVSSSWVAMKTITNSNVAHNADGTGTCFIEGYCIGPEGTSMAGHAVSGSQTVNLDRIPRYATSNQSLNSKTVNSIKMNWSSDSTIDYIWYSINNGSSWTAVGSVNASSGNYTISGLSPNTAYNIKTRVRRKDSQLTTDSSVLSVTTYQIATLASVPNVNIGAEQTITWNNPGSSAISLKLCKTDNTQIINYGTVTGTSKKVTPTASTIYALTPNSNTYTARYILTTTVNGTNYTNSKDFVFTVTNSNPTFSNFTFKNVNTTTYNGSKKLDDLTGSDQILVKGFSNVQATISDANKAVARNSATLKSYSLTIGSKSATNSTLSYPLNMTANAVDNSNIVVAAVDSRGNSTKVTKTATYKAYTDLVISSLTATRSNNGVGTTLTIAFNGTFWNGNFGSILNTIVSATYKYRKTTDSSWSSEIAVTPTISGGNYSASITPNITFAVESSYYIYITVKDYLETRTYQITVGAGTPALAIYKDRVAIGKKYDTSEGSKLQVNGDVKADNFKGNATSATSATKATQDSDGNQINTTYLKKSSLVSNNLVSIVANTTTDSGWSMIDGNYTGNNGYILKSVRYQGSSPNWGVGNYGSGICFGGADTKGLLSIAYDRPYIKLAGGNGTPIKWWIGLTGTSGRTYDLNVAARVNLYNNTSGTNGTITLSETSANFNYIDIYYKNVNGEGYGSVRVYSPNGKKIDIANVESNNTLYVKMATLSCSGTSLSFSSNHEWYYGGTINHNSGKYILIVRVDGYR